MLYKDFPQSLRTFPGESTAFSIVTSGGLEPVNYETLNEQIALAQSILIEKGLKQGDVACIVLNFSAELVVWLLACVDLGIISSVFPYHYVHFEKESDAKEVLGLVSGLDAKAIITKAPLHQSVLAISDGSPLNLVNSDDLESHSMGSLTAPSQPVQPNPEDIAYIQLSSGTTGPQKGVKLSYRAINACLLAASEREPFDPEKDVFFNWMPLYHDFGIFFGLILPLAEGVPLLLSSPKVITTRPHIFFNAIDKYKVTISMAFNSGLHILGRSNERFLKNVDLTSLTRLFCGGEPNHFSSQQAFVDKFGEYGLRRDCFRNGYGMAEAVFAISIMDSIVIPPTTHWIHGGKINIGDRVQFGSAGEAGFFCLTSNGPLLKGMEVAIQDENGEFLENEYFGEILIRAPWLFSGYVHNRDNTVSTDEWFATGDIGVIIENEVFVSGRKKDIIIVGGQNIYPSDIETEIIDLSRGSLQKVVCIGIPDYKTGTERMALLCKGSNTFKRSEQMENEWATLKDEIRSTILKKYNVSVSEISLIDSGIIKTSSAGKVSRALTRDAYVANRGSLNSDERQDLRAIINREYNLEIKSDNVNLLNESIDSLTLLGIILLAEEFTKHRIPTEKFLENPTIAFLKNENLETVARSETSVHSEKKRKSLMTRIVQTLVSNGPYYRGLVFIPHRPGVSLLRFLISIPFYRKWIYSKEIEVVNRFLDAIHFDGNRNDVICGNLYANSWNFWREALLAKSSEPDKYILEENLEQIDELLQSGKNVILGVYHSPLSWVWIYTRLLKKYPFKFIAHLLTKELFEANDQLQLPEYMQDDQKEYMTQIRLDQLYKSKKLLEKGGSIVIVFIDEVKGDGGIVYQHETISRFMRPGALKLAEGTETYIVPAVHYLRSDSKIVVRYENPIIPDLANQSETLEKMAEAMKKVWTEHAESLNWWVMSDVVKLSEKIQVQDDT